MRLQLAIVWGVALLFAIVLLAVLVATEGAGVLADPAALAIVLGIASVPGLIFTGMFLWMAHRRGAPLTRDAPDPRVLAETAVYDALGFLVAGRMRNGALLFHDQDYRRTEVDPAQVLGLQWLEGSGSPEPPMRLVVDLKGRAPVERLFGLFEDIDCLRAELAGKLNLR